MAHKAQLQDPPATLTHYKAWYIKRQASYDDASNIMAALLPIKRAADQDDAAQTPHPKGLTYTLENSTAN